VDTSSIEKQENLCETFPKTKIDILIDFHEFCEKSLFIQSYGKRESFFYAIEHLNTKKFFVEMKQRRNSSGFNLFESHYSSSEVQEDLPRGITGWFFFNCLTN
jgi:hypothetical protein